MERARKQRGFTIIEVLIVLAVTAAMFILAVYAINGKQNQAEFQQSINDIRSTLQQEIDQVAAGDYAYTGNFRCDGSSGNLVITSLPGANNQGSNTGCVYLGKVLQFAVQGSNPQQFITYTLAGLQNNTGTLVSAQPKLVAPGNATNIGYPDASVTKELHYGLNVVSMTSNGINVGAVAITSSLGKYSGGQLLSGSQTLDLIPIKNSALNQTAGSTVDAVNTNITASPVDPASGVQICFASGGTKESGLITLGGGGRNISVTLKIFEGDLSCT